MVPRLGQVLDLVANGPANVRSATLGVKDVVRDASGKHHVTTVRRIWFAKPSLLRVESQRGGQFEYAVRRGPHWWVRRAGSATVYGDTAAGLPPTLNIQLIFPADLMSTLVLSVDGVSSRLARAVVSLSGRERAATRSTTRVRIDVDREFGTILFLGAGHVAEGSWRVTEVLSLAYDTPISPHVFALPPLRARGCPPLTTTVRETSNAASDESSPRFVGGTARTTAQPIRVLRVSVGHEANLSARIFEDRFGLHGSAEVVIRRVPGAAWLGGIIGSADGSSREVARRFRDAVRGYDFVCPDFRVSSFAPLLCRLRTDSHSDVRLLLLAHSPGAIPLELALLRRYFRPGDRIFCGTQSASETISFLVSELRGYVRVVPHPVPDLAIAECGRSATRHPRLVSLVRFAPSKLVHRQIDAANILRGRGLKGRVLAIAGFQGGGVGTRDPYVRSLEARIDRYALRDAVCLLPPIVSASAKAQFLSSAAALVNLSASVEESFGQAVAEALSAGTPVLATRWNGLPETVGRGGICVPVLDGDRGFDVPPVAIADALESLLEDPPSADLCREEASRFAPAAIQQRVASELEAALEERDAGTQSTNVETARACSGLLDSTAPLTALSDSALDAIYDRGVEVMFRRIVGGPGARTDLDELRALVVAAVRRDVERQLAGWPRPAPGSADVRPADSQPGAGLWDAVLASVAGEPTPASRSACLRFLVERGAIAEIAPGLQRLKETAGGTDEVCYIEALAMRNASNNVAACERLTEDPEQLRRAGAAHILRLLAAAARDCGQADVAAGHLRSWLALFPDSHDSALVWWEYARLLSVSGPHATDTRCARARALDLLGLPTIAGALDSRRLC